MRKIFFITLFFASQLSFSISNSSWRVLISYQNIENTDARSAIPTWPVFIEGEIDWEQINSYVNRLEPRYIEDDEEYMLVLRFGVSSKTTILEMDQIIQKTITIVKTNYPEYWGTIIFGFTYSSMNDNWLILPPPPPPTEIPWLDIP